MLYLVATPIGNLRDITLRALDVLRNADLILSENPMTTLKILKEYHIKTPLKKLSEHNPEKIIYQALQRLKKGEEIVFVSEAGTPGIADPGGKLVQQVVNSLPNIKIVPVPGPSALTAVLSISGIPTNRFLFLGFLPKKKQRQKYLTIIQEAIFPVVCYESVHRIKKLLIELQNLGTINVIVGRELTKKFETIYRGSPSDVLSQLTNKQLKGEFVLVIYKKKSLLTKQSL